MSITILDCGCCSNRGCADDTKYCVNLRNSSVEDPYYEAVTENGIVYNRISQGYTCHCNVLQGSKICDGTNTSLEYYLKCNNPGDEFPQVIHCNGHTYSYISVTFSDFVLGQNGCIVPGGTYLLRNISYKQDLHPYYTHSRCLDYTTEYINNEPLLLNGPGCVWQYGGQKYNFRYNPIDYCDMGSACSECNRYNIDNFYDGFGTEIKGVFSITFSLFPPTVTIEVGNVILPIIPSNRPHQTISGCCMCSSTFRLSSGKFKIKGENILSRETLLGYGHSLYDVNNTPPFETGQVMGCTGPTNITVEVIH